MFRYMCRSHLLLSSFSFPAFIFRSLGIVTRICVTLNYPSFVLSWHCSWNLFNKQAISPCSLSYFFLFSFFQSETPCYLAVVCIESPVVSYLCFGPCCQCISPIRNRQLLSLSWRDPFSSVVSYPPF